MNFIKIFAVIIFLYSVNGCRPAKKLQTTVNKNDSGSVSVSASPSDNSISVAKKILKSLHKNEINYKTFSAKIKVEYEDDNGKQPDFNAFVRLQKDHLLWASLNATFLNIEAFRVLISPDSITIINKLDKTVESHPFSYISDIAHIPLTFSTLQDLVVGNPVYLSDNIVSFDKTGNAFLIGTIGELFKNLVTISEENNHLIKSKLQDIGIIKTRTALLLYDNYEQLGNGFFATERQISVAEKTKVNIQMSFKQFEFNKELSFPFSIPQNYKRK